MTPFLISTLRTTRRHDIIHVTILPELTQRNINLIEKIIAFQMTYKLPAFKDSNKLFLRSHKLDNGPHREAVASSPDSQTLAL
jgi:hypothetical protein